MGKISIVDIIAVLLVAVCVIAVGIKLNKKKEVSGGDKEITFSVKISGIRDVSVNAIEKEYKNIIDAESKKLIGDIVDVKTTTARSIMQLDDGEYKIVEYDNRFDAVITLKSNGSETDDGYFTSSGKQIIVGDTMGFNNGYAQFFAEVISVKAE